MKKYFSKILLVLLGIIAAIIFIEITLQIVPFLIDKSLYTRTSNIRTDDLNKIRILCIGDSMTYGVGVESSETYPAVLQKLLNNISPNKYVVYNLGHHGMSSSIVLDELGNNIKQYKPSIALIMIGSCDDVILEKSNSYLFSENTIQRYLMIININFNRLKIVKLFRIIFLNNNNGKINNDSNSIEENNPYTKEVKFWIQKCNEKLNPGELIYEGEELVKIYPNVEIFQQLALLYQQKGEFEKSFLYFDKALEKECTVQAVKYIVEEKYIRQRQYKKALAILEKYKNVFIKENKLNLFIEMKNFCKSINKYSESKTLIYNYSKMYSILKKENINTLFIGYPKYIKTENELLTVKQNLNVEVLLLFKDVFKDKDVFLRYDGYCTKLGYEKIATMIFNKLQLLKWIK